jgi:hypothetical protein
LNRMEVGLKTNFSINMQIAEKYICPMRVYRAFVITVTRRLTFSDELSRRYKKRFSSIEERVEHILKSVDSWNK